MKKLLTPFAGLALLISAFLFSTQAVAQGTHESGAQGLVIRLTTNGTNTDYYAGSCGYGTTPSNPVWGGSVTDEFCAPVAWAYGANQDTFGCSALPAGSLTGKVALLRRGPITGACGFSLKALNAQNAGAKAVLVANHNGNANENDCFVQNMGAGPEAAQVTVPVFFICRAAANAIDAAIRSGNGAEICFIRPDVAFPNIYLPTASKRTPVSQIPVDTLGFAVYVNNNKGVDLVNMELKAEVLDAANNVLYTTNRIYPTFEAGITDSFCIISEGQFAPELPVGEYTVRYTSTHDNVALSTRAETKFFVTNNLFAKDDGATIGFRTAAPATPYGVGCLYTINPKATEKYKATTAQFQFTTDPAELAPSDVSADIALFKVKDAVNFNDFGNTFTERDKFYSNSFDWVGTAPYDAPDGTATFTDQNADIFDINTFQTGVELENGKRYILALAYSGNNRLVFHAFDDDPAVIGYPSMFIFWPTAAGATTNNWFTGFANSPGLNVVLRMIIDLVSTTDENPLSESSLQIRPNPIVETLNLQVELDQATDLTVTIADLTGRVITYEVRENFSNGLLTYQLPQLATGTYLARIATKQGTLTKKFIVQK